MTVTEMANKVAAGEAEVLFPDDCLGPHYYQDRWWVMRHGVSRFEPVSDPDLSRQLTHQVTRLREAGRPTVTRSLP